MWKNLLSSFYLFCFRPKPHPKNCSKKKRLLVVSTTALGDSLWALPAIESLRSSFPNSYLALLTSPIGKEVFTGHPCLDQIYEIKRPIWKCFFSMRKKLYKEKFDAVLLFHASDRLIFLLSASLGAQELIGTEKINKGLDRVFSKLLLQEKEHEIVRRLKIVEAIGGKRSTEILRLPWNLPKNSCSKTKPTIALHPGSKDSFKRWKLEHFITVANFFLTQGFEVIVTGSFREKELIDAIVKNALGSTALKEGLSLQEFAKKLSEVDLLICNDTGPFHLASSLDIPTLAIFGPTDPFLCGPHLAKKSHVIQANLSCTPCLKRKCPIPFCLWQIGPHMVIEKACDILKSS